LGRAQVLSLKARGFTLLITGAKAIRKDRKKRARFHLNVIIVTKKKRAAVVLRNSFLKYWFPFYLYAGCIFLLSGISKPLPDIGIPFFDKFLHISEFAIFGLLASRAFKNSHKRLLFENFKIIALLVSVLYGISDEFHQSFISGRECSFFDLIADSIGGFLGVAVYSVNFNNHE